MKKLFKQTLSIMLTIVMLFTAVSVSFVGEAIATSGTCSADDGYSNVTWSYNGGTLTIAGRGQMSDYDENLQPWYNLTEEITDVVFGNEVEGIGARAFANCINLTSLSVPANVKVVGDSFISASGVTSVTFENGKRDLILDSQTFYNAKELNEVVGLSERAYRIGSDIFIESGLDKEDYGIAWYYDDILLKVDSKKYGLTEYTVEEGTKVIASGISALDIELSLPESVVSVTSGDNIKIKNFPKSLIHLPSTYNDYISENYVSADAITKKLEEWKSSGKKDYIYDFKITKSDFSKESSMLQEIVDEMIYFYTFDGWYLSSHSNLLLSSYLNITTDKLKKATYDFLAVYPEGIVGIKDFDLYDMLAAGMTGIVPIGNILPKSLRHLSPYSIAHFITEEKDVLSVTFLNPDCDIYDYYATISTSYVICGYPGSTAEAYAKKYNRTFIDITNCQHQKTCQRGYFEPTCIYDGYTGDTYCQYCGEFISKGTVIPQIDHSYTEWKITQQADCTTDGIRTRSCEECELKETEIYQKANGHNLVAEVLYAPTCTGWGETLFKCTNCSYIYTNWLDTTDHTDSDHNGYCDICNKDLTKDCNCNCHKTGFASFIWKIINFFNKLFRSNRICSCGVYHY